MSRGFRGFRGLFQAYRVNLQTISPRRVETNTVKPRKHRQRDETPMTDTKTSEMVERCAAAVRACYPDTFNQAEAEKLARAVIEAMREPTQNMLDAGYEVEVSGADLHDLHAYDCLPSIFSAMIDEALR